MTTRDPPRDRFDPAMRALHADAVAHVSTGTMAQLHRRRQAALSAKRPAGVRWRLPAAAFASLLVVAVGLGFGLHMVGDAPDAARAPAIAAAPTGSGIEGALDDLGQSPDFYLWLASNDATLLAME